MYIESVTMGACDRSVGDASSCCIAQFHILSFVLFYLPLSCRSPWYSFRLVCPHPRQHSHCLEERFHGSCQYVCPLRAESIWHNRANHHWCAHRSWLVAHTAPHIMHDCLSLQSVLSNLLLLAMTGIGTHGFQLVRDKQSNTKWDNMWSYSIIDDFRR